MVERTLALDEVRGLDTGDPGLWARHLDGLGADGNRVLPIGADASHRIDGWEDVIVAFVGATTALAWWLDSLADHGRSLDDSWCLSKHERH